MENMEDRYKKKNPFTVPERYFDELPDRIIARVQMTGGGMKRKPVRFLRAWRGAVAVVAVSLGIWLSYMMASHNLDRIEKSEEEYVFDSQFNPTNEEIIEYLTSELDSYEWVIAGIY